MKSGITHKCEVRSSWKSFNYRTQIHNFSGLIKDWTLISERPALNSLCFRTRASIHAEINRQNEIPYFIIHPFSKFRVFWEAWMILTYSIAFVFIPFEACNIFYTRLNPSLFINYGIPVLVMHFIFILDMVITFFTGYVQSKRKKVILKPQFIALKYLKTYLIVDIVGTVPALLNAIPLYFGRGKVLYERMMILNFVKLARVLTEITYKTRLFNLLGLTSLPYTIFRFTVRSIYFFHVAACLLFIMPFTLNVRPITVYSANTWIHTIQANIQQLSIGRFYLSSLYNAINLTLSCAAHRTETYNYFLTSILYSISGLLYNCFLFIQLLDIIRAVMEPETKYDEFITQLRDYMRHNQLPTNIQQRMYLFYEHRYQKVYFREEAILNTLSKRMLKDINDFGSRMMLSKVKILSGLSKEFADEIVDQFIPKVYLPKDVICKGSSFNRYVYFLFSGTVIVYTVSGREICHLYDGDYFGELPFMMKDHKNIVYVYALEICEIYLLDREVFLRAIASNPDIFDSVVERAKRRLKATRAVEAAQKNLYENRSTITTDIFLV